MVENHPGQVRKAHRGNPLPHLLPRQIQANGIFSQDLLDERLLPDPDPFQWNPNMLRILRKVVLDCRTEEQVNEVLWAGVKSETVVYAWEDYPLTPSMVKFARQHWEVGYKSENKPESDSEEE